MKKKTGILAVLLAVITIAADQLSKHWALQALELGERRDLLGKYLGFELHFNPGAAFSFLTGATWLFTLVAVAVAILIPLYVRRIQSVPWIVTLAVVWGGAVGNLLDRLFRAPGFGRGHVVDFIAYADWFIGNVADIALVGGILLLFVFSFTVPQAQEQVLEKSEQTIKEDEIAESSAGKEYLDASLGLVTSAQNVDEAKVCESENSEESKSKGKA